MKKTAAIAISALLTVGLFSSTSALAAPSVPSPGESSGVSVPTAAKYPSEWSSPNGDWAIKSVYHDGDTTLAMGTFSHRGEIRVQVQAPDGTRHTHSFMLEQSAMEDWYQFSGSWRELYPNQGPGQYKVKFLMESSGKWVNITDRTLGFVVS